MYKNLGNRHREDQERREMLAERDIIPPRELSARWNLEDTLRAIDEAEPMWRAGHSGHGWEGLKLLALGGKTPDEARALVRARYEAEWGPVDALAV